MTFAGARLPTHRDGQPLLALLDGYSVDFVHGILKRANNTFGNFFPVSIDGRVDTRQRAGMAETPARERLATATELAELQRALPANAEMDEFRIQCLAVKAS